MKILHTVSSFSKESYGLGTISMGLVKAQLDLGEEVYIWSSDKSENILWASENYNISKDRLNGFPSDLPLINFSIKEFKEARLEKSFDIVHQHSLWTSQSLITSELRKNGSKTCIAAHGTLSEFSLNKSKFKKDVALNLFERNNLKETHVLHATSEYEIEDFRRLGLTNPIAYIENGIGSQFIDKKGNGTFFKKKFNIPTNKKVLLYLSRITPKKGLDMLLKAMAEIKDQFEDWVLVIVGNDEFDYQMTVENMILEMQLSRYIYIIGPQLGNEKFDAFDASDFFILPSYSEGSPMVVVDALAYGIPVITTKSSSWKDLNDYECGFWVDIDQNAIRNAILNMVNLQNEDIERYSKNAKTLIAEKYLWDEIAKKTITLYEWILENNTKPNFIY